MPCELQPKDTLHPDFSHCEPHTNISAFEQAELHQQTFTSWFYSGEINRKWWGWDVISTSLGLRYIYYGEAYEFFSYNDTVGTGLAAVRQQ